MSAEYTVSRRQLIRLHTTLTDLGVTDRAEKLRLVAACIYRTVASTRDLSWSEASVAINTLGSVVQVRGDRRAALDRLLAVADRRAAS